MPLFQPILSPWLLLGWAILFALLALRAFHAQKNDCSTRIRGGLLALRMGAVLLLTLWILQPIGKHDSPKPGASRILILADASASMSARQDCIDSNGHPVTRWQAAWHLAENTPKDALVTRWRFCNGDTEQRSWPTDPAAVSPLPGETNLGAALDDLCQEATRPGAMPIQSVLMISDGREWNDNTLNSAKRLADQGIPVSTICLGSPILPGDLVLEFTGQTPDNVDCQLTADAHLAITNTYPEEKNTVVTFRNATGELLGSRTLLLPPKGQVECVFPFPISDLPGEGLFQAEITEIPGELTTENNRDAHILEYRHPPELRVLYLAANPDWEWRFLRSALEHSKDMKLSALIRLGLPDVENDALSPDWKPNVRFFHLNWEGPETFPEDTASYAGFDAVLLPCSATTTMSQKQQDALRTFVERQGGGLLWIGDATNVPEGLRTLLPGTIFETRQAGLTSKAILSAEGFLFEDLFQPPVPLTPGSHYVICRQPRKTARMVLRDDRGNALLLAQGNYGAGRVAWTGMEESWQWAFGGNESACHTGYWRQMTSWLGANRQPQLEAELPPEGLETGREGILAIRILGPDFLPAPAPRAKLIVTPLGETPQEVPLLPDPQEEGRYLAHYTPQTPTPLSLRFEVQCTPETNPMALEKYLLVQSTGKELSDLTPNPRLMREIARITNGAALQNSIPWEKLPKSQNVPREITYTPWMPSWMALPLTALLLLTEYALRRRHGLH